MENTIAAVDQALIETRDAMYAADVRAAEAELEVQSCRARLDELLEIRTHIPLQRLPSESTRGRAPGPVA